MINKEFEQLRFKYDEKKGLLEVIFLDHFYFVIPKEDLKILGKVKSDKNVIEFERKELKFENMIDNGFNNLKSRITGKKTFYIHQNSNIPLIGNGSFGIIERGTNLIEIKPVTGCNIDCVYCSVDENRRDFDIVIEKDYLINELKKVVSIKKNPVEIHIGCQGEPFLYSAITELIRDCKSIEGVTNISIDTNITLLNEKKIDDLISAGLTQINASLNSLNIQKSKKIANSKFYNVNHVKKMIEYISTKNVKLVIAPVRIQGLNDDDMKKIIEFSKSINATLGIQNYFNYSFGKKVGKAVSMEVFNEELIKLEKKHDVKLIISLKDDFNIVNDEELPKPFKKGQAISAKIICQGRFNNEFLALKDERTISIYDDTLSLRRKMGHDVKIRITRSKHNIYTGEII